MPRNLGEAFAAVVTHFSETNKGVLIDTTDEPNKAAIHALVNAPGSDWKVGIVDFDHDEQTFEFKWMKFYLSRETSQQFLAVRQKQ